MDNPDLKFHPLAQSDPDDLEIPQCLRRVAS